MRAWLLTLQEEQERQSSWCLALHPSLGLSVTQSGHFFKFTLFSFSVFLLHLIHLFCSLCFCSCLLLLTPPSRSSFLFSFTLALLPTEPEVNRDPLLRLACHSLTLSKTPLCSKSWNPENSCNKCTVWWLFCTCHSDPAACTQTHFASLYCFPQRGDRVLLWDVQLRVACGFIGFCGEVK